MIGDDSMFGCGSMTASRGSASGSGSVWLSGSVIEVSAAMVTDNEERWYPALQCTKFARTGWPGFIAAAFDVATNM